MMYKSAHRLMTSEELRSFLHKNRLLSKFDDGNFRFLINSIHETPRWHLFLLDASKNTIPSSRNASDFKYICTDLVTQSIFCKLKGRIIKLGVQLLCWIGVVIVFLVGFSVIYFTFRYRRQFEADVFGMIEAINRLLIKQRTASRSDSNIHPFMSVNHVYESVVRGGSYGLESISTNSYREKVWKKAEQIVRRAESRIREEYQIIDGEECLVWRWIGLT
ncbi:hypothetical protein ACOME3_000346 [Neoechinorhynchus agilis]